MARFRALLLLSGLLACSGPEAPAAVPGDDGSLSPAGCHYDSAPARPSAAAPGPLPLRAGVGEEPLDLPVGTPLGGYSARIKLLGGHGPDGRQAAAARTFAPSAGVQSRPLARALFLQAGGAPVLLIKADLCVAFDRLVYDLEQALSPEAGEAGGASLRGHVILAASHSHSAPGTYQGVFHLTLGFDVFQEDQYQRLLGSLVRAGKKAMSSAGPARIGAGVWEGWDPKDQIFSDRRGEDDVLKGPDGKPVGPHKDQRLLVLRIDDDRRQPLALLFHFPMHGTVAGEDNPLMSVDSTGHVELALEERFDRPVLVMHLQGPAGDASPRGLDTLTRCDKNKMVCADFARMETIGELAAPRILELFSGIETRDQLDLEIGTRTVPDGRAISVRDGLRYAPYEPDRVVDSTPAAIYAPDGQIRSPISQFNVPSGAGLCGAKKAQLPVMGIEGADGIPYGSCVELGAAARFIASVGKVRAPMVPECETTRTTLSALRLSGVPVARRQPGTEGQPPIFNQRQEDLLLLTLPGEPLSLWADRLRARSPAGPDRTFVVGYAQGHVGYILEPENWLLGGYEPSINIYGPLEGEWLMERSLELGKVAWTPEREDPEAGPMGLRYDRLRFEHDAPRPVSPVRNDRAGQPADMVPAELFVRSGQVPKEGQPAPTIPRVGGRALFVFHGGDPLEDLPLVTLERELGGGFQPVLLHSGRPLGSRGREMILTYTPVPVTAPPGQATDHLWAVEWQAVGWDRALGAPLGRYRFSIAGRAGGKDYRVASRPFTLVADGALAVSATRTDRTIKGRALYPVGPGYRLLRLGMPSDGQIGAAGTVAVRVQAQRDGASQRLLVAAAADGSFQAQPDGLDLSMGAVVTVEDEEGNSGTATVP